MFKLGQKFEVDKRILNCDYIQYPPAEISTKNTTNSQIYIKMPTEDSAISLSNSYLELNSVVLQAASNNRYVDTSVIRLVNLGPIALFSN